MLIYKLTSPSNKVYVGQTTRTLNKRMSEYRSDIKNKNRPILMALRKYGFANFKIEVLEYSNNINELNNKEIFWIDYFNCIKLGYNILSGGNNHSIKLTGQRLQLAQYNIRLATIKAAETFVMTEARIKANTISIKKAYIQSAKNRLNKPLSNQHKTNICKGLINNPKVKLAAQKPRINNRVKLNNIDIINIQNSKLSGKQLAILYKVSVATISRIKNKLRYFKQ
jgi:group I intron endonuclease